MRSAFRLASLAALLLLLGACSQGPDALLASAAPQPEVIALPDGFRPEGIVAGRGATAYAGSLGSGAVVEIDLFSGAVEIAVPEQVDRRAVGLAYQTSRDRLFVAGGNNGEAYVYDASTGASLASYALGTQGASFVNDVVLTRDAAYLTDSFQSVLYVLPLAPDGSLPTSTQTLPLSGDWVAVSGFNANGIEATADGGALIVVNSTTGNLYRVDPVTGVATLVDLGGDDVANGDGLLLQGRTLYVVQNSLNRIAVVELAPDLASGEIVGFLIDDDFDVPTTVAGFGDALYAVNARFSTPATPTTSYQVVRVDR